MRRTVRNPVLELREDCAGLAHQPAWSSGISTWYSPARPLLEMLYGYFEGAAAPRSVLHGMHGFDEQHRHGKIQPFNGFA